MDKVLKNYEELSRKTFTPINIVPGDSVEFTWTPHGTPEQLKNFRAKYGLPDAANGGYCLNSVTLQEGGRYSRLAIDTAVIFGAEFEGCMSLGCIAMDSTKKSQ